MSILYTQVARADDRQTLVEHADCEGNIRVVAREFLTGIQKSGYHSMKTDNNYLLSYHMDDRLIVMAMSQKQDTTLISAFLSKIRKEFEARYKTTSSEKELKKFEPLLGNLMKDFNSGNNKMLLADEEIRKLEKEVIETQKSLIGRTEDLNLLVRKTDDMVNQGSTLYTGAVNTRNELWWRKMRNYAILIGVVALVILVALFYFRII